MARNSEKAQSMLYRFRESQAIEMGMGNRQKGDRRPRMASSVTSLRECERWRGDILKEISRKVAKIQDATLTDYEIRDLNDEINGLMREKRHFETQIVNLGGANYKRGNQAMVDDDGREVPGTRGYKYFGRAKDLPGVKEMFTRGAAQASEESARNASFQMFRNQGTEYYGDNDEVDGSLIEEEDDLARKGWEEAVGGTAAVLSLQDISIPYPTSSKPSTSASSAPSAPPANQDESGTTTQSPKKKGRGKSKRKAGPNNPVEEEIDESSTAAGAKKAKMGENGETENGAGAGAGAGIEGAAADDETARQAAAIAARFFGVLDPESLRMPVIPTTEQMGEVLLEVRKKALREEYGV